MSSLQLYYNLFEPVVTGPHLPTVLLLHGFAGTPENDFAGQLPALRILNVCKNQSVSSTLLDNSHPERRNRF